MHFLKIYTLYHIDTYMRYIGPDNIVNKGKVIGFKHMFNGHSCE